MKTTFSKTFESSIHYKRNPIIVRTLICAKLLTLVDQPILKG